MKFKYFFIFIFLFTSFALTSCNGDDDVCTVSLEINLDRYTTVTRLYERGSQIDNIDPVIIQGYSFVDWFYDEELTKPVVFPITIDSDATFYAKYTKETQTAEFNFIIDEYGYIKITGYNGNDGFINIPNTIDGILVQSVSIIESECKSIIECISLGEYVLDFSYTSDNSISYLTAIFIPFCIQSIDLREINYDLLYIYTENKDTINSSVIHNFHEITMPMYMIANNIYFKDGVIYELHDDYDAHVFMTTQTFKSENFIIPSTINNNYVVSKILDSAFESNNYIKSLVLPSTLEVIKSSAFKGCTNLEKINIPSSVTTIESHAFSMCTSLKSVAFEENSLIKSIGTYTFSNCSSLEKIELSVTLELIDYSAFNGCSNLKSITVPFIGDSNQSSGMTRFGYIFGSIEYSNSYKACGYFIPKSLVEVIVLQDITYMDSLAFGECEYIETITFKGDVSKIGLQSFKSCSKLTNLNFDNLCIDIFYLQSVAGCTSLEYIVMPSTITTIYLDNNTGMEDLIFFVNKLEDEVDVTDYIGITTKMIYWKDEWTYDENGIPSIL